MCDASISMLVFFNGDMTATVGSMLNVNADNRTWMKIGIEDEVFTGLLELTVRRALELGRSSARRTGYPRLQHIVVIQQGPPARSDFALNVN